VISEAGGLKNDAGNSLKITRRNEMGQITSTGKSSDRLEKQIHH